MGKLFIIEGIDGSGKSTQLRRLRENLEKRGTDLKTLKFPRYDQPSATLLNMYLHGEFGTSPDAVNAYAASVFFAVDRYASYKLDWKEDYDNGRVLLFDRYVSSNLIHQGSKLSREEALEFFKWLYEFEFDKLGLPRPDSVFFLDVPPEIANRQVESRYCGDEGKKDIHEKDTEYLRRCYETGMFACEHGYMTRIECVRDGKLLSVEEIEDDIIKKVTEKL